MKRASSRTSAFPAWDSILQDLRFGLRLLRRSPGFTALAVLTMALGIGANTAVFSVVNAVILRPLRIPDPQRVMVILSATRDNRSAFPSAQGVYVDWRNRATAFESIAGARATLMILTGVDQARMLQIAATSYDFFQLAGARPILGRTFSQEEDQADKNAVALLGEGFWRSAFGADPKVLGRTLALDGKPFTVIGVLPASLRFAGFGARDAWIPLAANRSFRSGGDVIALGRLRPTVTPEAAQKEMDAVMQQIRREQPQDSQTYALVKPLQEWMVGEVRPAFLVMLGAVAFVLLICCANIANLLLARATTRQREIAVRAALGAGRGRLIRQTLVESLLLSGMGGAAGAGLAALAVRAVPAIRSFYIPRLDEISVDHTVFIAAAAAALACGILFGLAPAFQLARGDLGAGLHEGSAITTRVGGMHVRNALVVAQLALAAVLLCGAGLMTNTLLRLLNVDLGFQREHILTVRTLLPYQKYDATRRAEFERRLAAEVSRMPGVRGVSVTDNLPLQAVLFPYQLRAGSGEDRNCEAMARNVDRGYFAALGIPLLAGRDFEPADDHRTPVPILVNRKTANALFGREDPLGRKILTDYRDRPVFEVIGVVGDVRQMKLTTEPGPQIYLPLVDGAARYVIARTAPNSGGLAVAIRAAARDLDRDVPAPEIATMDDWFGRQIAKPRFYGMLLAAVAGIGLVLAVIGIYGVVSYTVARRTREFGIRMALGAERSDILRLVLGAGARLTLAGVALGLVGAYAATQLLSALLYQVKPVDPLTMAGAAILLAGIALAACYRAARKAARTDPSVALRCE